MRCRALTSGDKIGVFCMQHGPGTENAFGGIAQAYGESIPILVLPGGFPRRTAQVGANFNATREMRGITQVGGVDHNAGRGRQRDAARILAFAQRPRRAGAGRDPAGPLERRGAGAARL